jgi:Fe-S-cluster containining protein
MENVPTPSSDSCVTTTVTLGGKDWRMEMTVTVPKGATSWRVVLPVLQSITNRIVDSAVEEVESAGERISCQKGCGACCRQLVPIAQVEAELLGELIGRMEEPHRAAILGRFAEARHRLEEAGMLESLRHPQSVPRGGWREIGLRYFDLGIACPFLEEESCSIHTDRPLACREYLVTTPAEHCAHPTAETVHCVALPLKPSNALMHSAQAAADVTAWVPLILASEQTGTHAIQPRRRPGLELVEAFFTHLARAGSVESPQNDPRP